MRKVFPEATQAFEVLHKCRETLVCQPWQQGVACGATHSVIMKVNDSRKIPVHSEKMKLGKFATNSKSTEVAH